MLKTKAIFARKENDFEPKDCVIEKTIQLSANEYDHFANNMLADCDFIKENKDLMHQDENGAMHCLLVTGVGSQDGILVQAEWSSYARYASFMPNAVDFLKMQNLPQALITLNKKLTDIVDYIVTEGTQNTTQGNWIFAYDDIPVEGFGETGSYNIDTICEMLMERDEVADIEIHDSSFDVAYYTNYCPNIEDLYISESKGMDKQEYLKNEEQTMS